MADRACFLCGSPIFESMGSVLARDFVMFMAGKRQSMREMCGKCSLRQSITGNSDLPPLTADEAAFTQQPEPSGKEE